MMSEPNPERRLYRRNRNELRGVPTKMLGYNVTAANKARWEDLAQSLEKSPSELFDLMVDNLQLDEYGRPVWMPPQPLKDGMLPIARP